MLDRARRSQSPPVGLSFRTQPHRLRFALRSTGTKVTGAEPASYTFTLDSARQASGGMSPTKASTEITNQWKCCVCNNCSSNVHRELRRQRRQSQHDGCQLCGCQAGNGINQSGFGERWEINSTLGNADTRAESEMADKLYTTTGNTGNIVGIITAAWSVGQAVSLRPALSTIRYSYQTSSDCRNNDHDYSWRNYR